MHKPTYLGLDSGTVVEATACHPSIPYGHRVSAALLPVQLTLMCLGKQWKRLRCLGPVPTWETQMKTLVPDFSLAQPQALQPFG